MFQTKLRSISQLVNNGPRFNTVKDYKFNEFEAYTTMKNAHVIDNLDEFETKEVKGPVRTPSQEEMGYIPIELKGQRFGKFKDKIMTRHLWSTRLTDLGQLDELYEEAVEESTGACLKKPSPPPPVK